MRGRIRAEVGERGLVAAVVWGRGRGWGWGVGVEVRWYGWGRRWGVGRVLV